MTHRRSRFSLFAAAALASLALLAFASPGMAAEMSVKAPSAKEASALGKAQGLKLIKRLALEPRRARRGSAGRGSRPSPHRRSRARGIRAAAQYYTNECKIVHLAEYFSNSTVLPYTWRSYQVNGVTYGYYLYNRFSWTFGVNGQPRYCGNYLGQQYEYFQLVGGQWRPLAVVNCDWFGCVQVR